jgi:hypothetical protein
MDWQHLDSRESSRSHNSARRIYRNMVVAGVDPDEFLVAAALSSCTSGTALELGMWLWVHTPLSPPWHGLALDSFLSVCHSTHAKIGSLGDARKVLDAMRRTNGATSHWRPYAVMVRSGCRHGYVSLVGDLLDLHVQPDDLVDSGRPH